MGAARRGIERTITAGAACGDEAEGRYLRDVLARLPDHPIIHLDELLPHRWESLPPTSR